VGTGIFEKYARQPAAGSLTSVCRTGDAFGNEIRGPTEKPTNAIREDAMKFVGTYAVSEDKWLPVLKKWVSMSPKERTEAGEGVEIIGRWHDMAARTGVVVFQSDNLAAVQRYAGLWNPYMEIRLVPVVDDEESAAVARQILADNNA